MEKFLAYVSAFDPAFASRIRGASAQEIGVLEAQAGHPLPDFYRAFLLRMGSGDDVLLGNPEVRTGVADLIAFYRDNVATGEDRIPSDCLVIGVGGASVGQVLLESREGGGVFEGDCGEKHRRWADSLAQLLYKRVYMRYRPRQFAHARAGSSACTRPVMELARAEALRLGFEPQWFSDPITFCAERADAALILNQLGGQGFSLRIATEDPRQAPAVLACVRQATGLMLDSTFLSPQPISHSHEPP